MVQVTFVFSHVAVVPLALTKGSVAKTPLRLALGKAAELDPQ